MRTMVNKYGKRITLPDQTAQGEQLLEDILKEAGLNYKMQFFFDEKGLRTKKYDAAVLHKSGEPAFLIEFDGREHYDPGWYEALGTRPERCQMHVVKANINEAKYTRVALMHGLPVLRVSYNHLKVLRDLILAYAWTFIDEANPGDPQEVSAVKMLDRYGWDFDYVEPSEPGKTEAAFLREREIAQLLS